MEDENIQNQDEKINIKVQEIMDLLKKRTEKDEISWEKSIRENCYYVEYDNGTILIYKSGNIIKGEVKKFIGLRLLSSIEAVYYEREYFENTYEYRYLFDFYTMIEQVSINNYLKEIEKDVIKGNFADPMLDLNTDHDTDDSLCLDLGCCIENLNDDMDEE